MSFLRGEPVPTSNFQTGDVNFQNTFLRGAFVPLVNFQPGSLNFQNTCFIAAVANMRHVLEPVMESVQDYNWKDYINFVRSNWNQKYEFAPGHNGQHDAAELLGDILYDHRFRFGVELCVCRQIFHCNHYRERSEHLSMIVLSLPIETGNFSIRRLRDDYFTPAEVNDLRCEECGMSEVSGICTQIYKRSLSGKLVFRINRYTPQGRRSDPVTLDETLTFENGDEYILEAILQHEGESIHGGHYIMFLRTNGAWERRDDGKQTVFVSAKLPPYSPENVYVVVYGLLRSNGSSSSSGSANPITSDFRNSIADEPKNQFPCSTLDPVPEEPKTNVPGLKEDDFDHWKNIPEKPKRNLPTLDEDDYDFWKNIREELVYVGI